jgi:hypothetical protein
VPIARFEEFNQLLGSAGVHPAERTPGRNGSSPEIN